MSFQKSFFCGTSKFLHLCSSKESGFGNVMTVKKWWQNFSFWVTFSKSCWNHFGKRVAGLTCTTRGVRHTPHWHTRFSNILPDPHAKGSSWVPWGRKGHFTAPICCSGGESRSCPGPLRNGHPPVSSRRGTVPLTPIPMLTSPSRRLISCKEEPRSRM